MRTPGKPGAILWAAILGKIAAVKLGKWGAAAKMSGCRAAARF